MQNIYSPYQYSQAPLVNNIDRNLIATNQFLNIQGNNNLPNLNSYNSFPNPMNNYNYPYDNYIQGIGMIQQNPIINMNNKNQYNPVQIQMNPLLTPISTDISNLTNEKLTKRELDKKRSLSSRYRADMSAIHENSNYENSSNISNTNNISKTNNLYSKRSGSNVGNNNIGGIYKPYNLDDYKKISNVKIELGSLGPNIGTREWEERQEKMKKMEEYAIKIKSSNKMVIKLKKDTPVELVEKEKTIKKENSNRYKAYKYDSLVRDKVTKINTNHINYIEDNSENNEISDIMKKYNSDNIDPKNNYRDYNYNVDNIRKNISENKIRNKNIEKNHNEEMGKDDIAHVNSKRFIGNKNVLNQIEENFNLDNNINNYNNYKIKEVNDEENEIVKLQRQRQALTSKINEIKESFL